MFDLSLESASRLQTIAALFGVFLAACAVLAGILSFWASSQVSKHNDRQLAEARATAELARSTAAANEQATEEIRRDNLQLQLRLAEEQGKREELQLRLGPRRVEPPAPSTAPAHPSLPAPSEKADTMSSIPALALQGIKVTLGVARDAEATNHAAQIFRFLQGLGCETRYGDYFGNVGDTGVLVHAIRPAQAKLVASALQQAKVDFKLAKLPGDISADWDGFAGADVYLDVNPKRTLL